MSEKRTTLESLMPLMQACFEEGKTFRFSPGGISMLPTIRPNRDVVVVSQLPPQLKKYDLPLYRRSGGEFVLHRIVEAGDTYTCVGDGQFELERGVTQEQMVAIVTTIIRNGREISVNAPMYRLYCRFWVHTRKIRHVIKWPKYYLRRALTWLKFKH